MNKDLNSEPYDLSKAQYFEAVAEMRQQSLRRAWAKIRKYREEANQLRAEVERVKSLNHQQFGDAIRKNAEVERLKTKIETIRCLLGSSVPSDAELDIAIDAALKIGAQS